MRYNVTSQRRLAETFFPRHDPARAMEPGCRFGLEYTPSKRRDPVLLLHMQNCEDCQGEVLVLE